MKKPNTKWRPVALELLAVSNSLPFISSLYLLYNPHPLKLPWTSRLRSSSTSLRAEMKAPSLTIDGRVVLTWLSHFAQLGQVNIWFAEDDPVFAGEDSLGTHSQPVDTLCTKTQWAEPASLIHVC